MRRIGGWLLGGGLGLILMGIAVGSLNGWERRALAQAQVTATPRPDGSIVHTVEEGDTLFGLALLYGTTVEEIKALNGLNSDLLIVGQELLIRPPQSGAASPTPTPAPVSQQPGALCTGAFEDRNGNEMKEDGEPWIAGISIYLIDGHGWKTTLISGAGQPACARDLAPGYYVLAVESPAGYQPSGPTRRDIWLPWNAEATLLFGFQLGAASTAPTPFPTTAPVTSAEVDYSRIGEGLLLGIGFIALLLVGGVVGYWMGQQRARAR